MKRFEMLMVLQYNGYPQRREKQVVKDNITGDEDWEENLLAWLEDDGVKCRKATIKSAEQPTTDDGFVCLRVTLALDCEGDEQQAGRIASEYCSREVDSEKTFYCDSCWVE
jgi:hypothetical protein